MIDRSSAYDQAITARRRRITVRATFDLRDPDAVVSGAASSAQSPYSQIAQVYDEITDQTDCKLGTLEQNRIQLDGSWALPPDDPDEVKAEQLGWWGGALSGADGTFSSPQPYIELSFSGMSILQAFTLWFSQNSYDGVPESFRVDVYSAATLAFSRIVEGNVDHQVLIEQFTVYDPTRIRINAQMVAAVHLPTSDRSVFRLVRAVERTGYLQRGCADRVHLYGLVTAVLDVRLRGVQQGAPLRPLRAQLAVFVH